MLRSRQTRTHNLPKPKTLRGRPSARGCRTRCCSNASWRWVSSGSMRGGGSGLSDAAWRALPSVVRVRSAWAEEGAGSHLRDEHAAHVKRYIQAPRADRGVGSGEGDAGEAGRGRPARRWLRQGPGAMRRQAWGRGCGMTSGVSPARETGYCSSVGRLLSPPQTIPTTRYSRCLPDSAGLLDANRHGGGESMTGGS